MRNLYETCLFCNVVGPSNTKSILTKNHCNIISSLSYATCSHPLLLGDMYNQEGDATEPEWVKTEREQFTEFRDKNKDGKMDKEETRDWILPNDYDHAEAEAKHLVYESDADKVRTVKVSSNFKFQQKCYASHKFYFLSHSLSI